MAAAFLALGAGIFFQRRKPGPEEQERLRRLAVNRSKRTIEGEVVDATDDCIHYMYDFRGVEYSSSQDLGGLVHLAPANLGMLIGCHVTVKFDPANPANSIVLCEEWSGLPGKPRGSGQSQL